MLFPLATQKIAIDLDDGVKANYPKFGTALKKFPALMPGRSRQGNMTANLLNNIGALFEQHRVVFWYDAQKNCGQNLRL